MLCCSGYQDGDRTAEIGDVRMQRSALRNDNQVGGEDVKVWKRQGARRLTPRGALAHRKRVYSLVETINRSLSLNRISHLLA